MQSASDLVYSQRRSCANFFRQIYKEEGIHGLYRVSRNVCCTKYSDVGHVM